MDEQRVQKRKVYQKVVQKKRKIVHQKKNLRNRQRQNRKGYMIQDLKMRLKEF